LLTELAHETNRQQRVKILLHLRNFLLNSVETKKQSADNEWDWDLSISETTFLDVAISQQFCHELQLRQLNIKAVELLCHCILLCWKLPSIRQRNLSMVRMHPYIPDFVRTWRFLSNQHSVRQHLISIFRLWSRSKDQRTKNCLTFSGFIPLLRKNDEWRRERPGQLNEDCLPSRDTVSADFPVDDSRLEMIAIIQDLSFRADDRAKEYLYTELYEFLLQQCSEARSVFQSNFRNFAERVLITFWNWAVMPTLAHKMASCLDLWQNIKSILDECKDSEPHLSDSLDLTIRRTTSSLLGTLIAGFTVPECNCTVSSTSNVPAIILKQSWFMKFIVNALRRDTDTDLRRRCMRLLRCLSGCNWGRSLVWSHHDTPEDLATVLIQVVRKTSDESDTRIQACQSLVHLLPSTGDEWEEIMPCLESSLIEVLEDPTADDKLSMHTCHALQACLTYGSWDRASCCFTMPMFEKLLAVLQRNASDPGAHRFISELVFRITERTQITTNRYIIDILILILQKVGPDFEPSIRHSLGAVSFLVQDESSKKAMAASDELLSTLVNFCLVTCGPEKDRAKEAILQLVPHL